MVSVSEQQPLEPADAFAAFSLYLSLGPQRSLAKTARQLGKNPRLIERWSVKFHWRTRVATHDAHAAQPHPAPSSPPSPIPPPDPQPIAANSAPPSAPSPALERLPRETNKAYAAFQAYVALGSDRSIPKAAASLRRGYDQLARWSAKYKWVSRVAAYHAHLARIDQQSAEDLVREKSRDWAQTHEGIRRQAWAEAEDLIALAQELKARWRNCDRVPEFGALLRALELAFKLKQFAAGMPNEVKQVNATVSGVNGGPVRLQFEAALKKIYGRPLPGEVIDVEPIPATPS